MMHGVEYFDVLGICLKSFSRISKTCMNFREIRICLDIVNICLLIENVRTIIGVPMTMLITV